MQKLFEPEILDYLDFKYIYEEFQKGYNQLNVNPRNRPTFEIENLILELQMKIYRSVDLSTWAKLRKTSHMVQNVVEDSEVNLESLWMNIARREGYLSHNEQYVKYSPLNSKDCTVAFKGRKKIITNSKWIDRMLADLETFITRKRFKTKKLTIDGFEMAKRARVKFMEFLQTKIPVGSLKVENLVIRHLSLDDAVIVLSLTDPKSIKEITLLPEQKEPTPQAIEKLNELVQWKNAKKLWYSISHSPDNTLPIEAILHFSWCQIYQVITPESIVKLREAFSKSPQFERCEITRSMHSAANSSSVNDILLRLGLPAGYYEKKQKVLFPSAEPGFALEITVRWPSVIFTKVGVK